MSPELQRHKLQEYIASLDYGAFEQFCAKYIELLPDYQLKQNEGGKYIGFDLWARHGNRRIAIECKSARLIDTRHLAPLLRLRTMLGKEVEVLLMLSGFISANARSLLEGNGIIVWDLVELVARAPEELLERVPEPQNRDEVSVLPMEYTLPSNILSATSSAPREHKKSTTQFSRSQEFSNRLNSIAPGKGGDRATRYEKWCQDVFDYLFRLHLPKRSFN